MLAISTAGHDRNTWYYIVKEEKDFVFLADGRIRTLKNPKKKNRKHIRIVKDETVPERDEDIRRLCKSRRKEGESECQRQM